MSDSSLFSGVMRRQHPLLGRRELLQAGILGASGLCLPRLLAAAKTDPLISSRPAARNCILFFLEGGPSHIDLWDMKPTAPAEIRGEFQPISTSNPDVQVCEHLPLLSRQMHLLTLVRSGDWFMVPPIRSEPTRPVRQSRRRTLPRQFTVPWACRQKPGSTTNWDAHTRWPRGNRSWISSRNPPGS
jgi:hypothetical protein